MQAKQIVPVMNAELVVNFIPSLEVIPRQFTEKVEKTRF